MHILKSYLSYTVLILRVPIFNDLSRALINFTFQDFLGHEPLLYL